MSQLDLRNQRNTTRTKFKVRRSGIDIALPWCLHHAHRLRSKA